MSTLPSHGTGWAESEALIDVVTIFNDWNGVSAPDFSVIEKRLHESFTVSELRNLETVAHALATLIDREIALRGSDSDYKHSSDPQH